MDSIEKIIKIKRDYIDAIGYLKESKCEQTKGEIYKVNHNIVLDLAIETLEKQIPKKPIIKHLEAVGEEPYIKLRCPNCHSRHSLGEVYDKYCKICGQKIDWS